MIVFVQIEQEVAEAWGGKSTDIAIQLEKILNINPRDIPKLKKVLKCLSGEEFTEWLQNERHKEKAHLPR